MKKVFLVITLAISLCALGVSQIKAADAVSFNNNTPVIKAHTEIKNFSIFGGAEAYSSVFTTYNGCVIEPKFLADHNTYWITPSVPVANTDIHVVAYSQGTNYNWEGARPTSIAKQYERDNPGWIVLGGINGDFFHINDNCEPSGTFMQNGDLFKSWEYNAEHQPLGFFEDGTYIAGGYDVSGKEHLKRLNSAGVYEDLGEIATVDAASLSTSGINLITRFLVSHEKYKSVDLTNTVIPHDLSSYKVVTVTYSYERRERNNGKVFVKGVVTDVTTGKKDWTISDSDSCSYLASADGSLDNLAIGDEIKCECVLGGEWAKVTNITGAYAEILTDNKVPEWPTNAQPQKDYVNTAKNRTIMGFKADGTPIMMCVEKQGISGYGASYQECGEILKGLGCVQGFLFDGGGSSTIFYRTTEGKYQIMNRTEDGSERSDANAVLLVCKDPGFSFKVDYNNGQATFTQEVTNANRFSAIKDIKIKFNNETKAFENSKATFSGLKLETSYNYSIEYTDTANDTNKSVTKVYNGTYTTPEFTPSDVVFSISEVNKNEVTITRTHNDAVQNVRMVLNGKEQLADDADTFTITDLDSDTDYEVVFKYEYNATEVGKVLKLESSKLTIHTLDKALPKLVKFELKEQKEDEISFNYQIEDEDEQITKAYLLVNTDEVAVDLTKKTIKVKDLDFANNEYTFKLICEYGSKKLESESLTYGTKPADPIVDPEPEPKPKAGCGKSAAAFVISLATLTCALGIVLKKRH